MKSIYLIIVMLSCFTFINSAQIQPESFDWETAQVSVNGGIWTSESGPLMIVKTDSAEYMLDSLWIDSGWIQSISVFKDGKATEMYGCLGKNGVILIALKEDHIEDFVEGKKPDNVLKIRKVD